jgi:uncharacterized protein (DUF302 family)
MRSRAHDFDKTVTTIVDNAKARGWLIPKVYDFQKSFIDKGQPDPGRIKIIKTCHPDFAGPLLQEDHNKFVSVMMPCSISVYEKKDGSIYVGSMNMGLMSKMFTGLVGETLGKVAKEDEAILQFLK